MIVSSFQAHSSWFLHSRTSCWHTNKQDLCANISKYLIVSIILETNKGLSHISFAHAVYILSKSMDTRSSWSYSVAILDKVGCIVLQVYSSFHFGAQK